MAYGRALEKAWADLGGLTGDERLEVKLLSDTYNIDLKNKVVTSLACNTPAKDHISLLMLHYLASRHSLGKLPDPAGEWIDFNQLEGGSAYYPTYRKRTIDRLARKYACSKEDFKKVIEVLPGVPVMITLSKADEEFGADANILYDKSIAKIFRTEDIVVLTEILTGAL